MHWFILLHILLCYGKKSFVYQLNGNGLAEFGFIGSLCPDSDVTLKNLLRLSIKNFYRPELARCPGDDGFLDAKAAPKTFCSNGDATVAARSERKRVDGFNQFILEGIMITRCVENDANVANQNSTKTDRYCMFAIGGRARDGNSQIEL